MGRQVNHLEVSKRFRLQCFFGSLRTVQRNALGTKYFRRFGDLLVSELKGFQTPCTKISNATRRRSKPRGRLARRTEGDAQKGFPRRHGPRRPAQRVVDSCRGCGRERE